MNKRDMLERLISYYTDGSKRGGKTAFAKKLGVKPQTISSWLERNTFDAELLFSKCENINPQWLLSEEGEMIISQQEITIHHTPKVPDRLLSSQEIYLYEFEASAGLVELLDNNRHSIIDVIRIPNLPKCDGAVYVSGDSMYPILKSGDIIMYRQIPLGEEYILYGEMYLLSYRFDGTDDYIVVKYVKRSELPGHVQLVSHNQHHSPKDIPLHSITAIAQIKASIRFNAMG